MNTHKFFCFGATALAVSFAHANTTQEEQARGGLDHERVAALVSQDQEVQTANEQAKAALVAKQPKQPTVIDASWTTDEVYQKLTENPQAFERMLMRTLAHGDAEALRVILPAYARYPQKDASAVDWGNALIALADGKTEEAVKGLRKVNAALPDVRLLRLQMASALYRNRQIKAAKDELQKLLRADNISPQEKTQITSYIDSINRLDKWNYGFNMSFVKDGNLDDSPPIGTTNAQGWKWTTPHEAGTGFKYSASADKRWSYDNQWFSTASLGLGGTHYWDNKKYNEVYANASVGIGRQTATSEIEFSPTLGKSWYGGGNATTNTNEKLKPYTKTVGAKLTAHKWLSPNLMYQHNTQYTDLKYQAPYSHNDGKVYSMNNGLLYAPNPKSYYSLGWNISKKDAVRPENSYRRSGVNFSWNNTWDKGIVTTASVGIASKKFTNQNFFGIKRHNHEYDLGLTVWKRDFSIFGLTPKLNLSKRQVQSNDAFEQKSSSDATISLSKTF